MSNELIFHLTSREDWIAAVHNGDLRNPSLEQEGFIHASTAEQIVDTANKHYPGRTDLVVVCIDGSRLTSELRYEAADLRVRLYPHIYGPINLQAVTQVAEMRPGIDGGFHGLPDGIETDGFQKSVWLRATNHDGSPHWQHPAPLVSNNRELTVTKTAYGTVVAREKGGFTSNFHTLGHYWRHRWYNVIRLEDAERKLQGYYCNIAQPVPFDGKTVRYVDLQLDVRVFVSPDGNLTWRLLDEDEFREARDHYGYDQTLVDRCYQAVDEVIAAVRARQFPFDS